MNRWHLVSYNEGILEGIIPPDGKWLVWMDIFGNTELARMKIDGIGHFFPRTQTIKEENVIAWRYPYENEIT